jgi:hypothetical protein
MNKRILQALFISLLMFLLIGVSACEKKYSGKIIDTDTKEPIEGAVVVASWVKARATIAGDDTNFYDVKETLTDKEGRWTIEGRKGNCGALLPSALKLVGISCIRKPTFIVFKPGYCSWPEGFGVNVCKTMRRYDYGTSEIAELPKLTNREDRLRVMPSPVSGQGAWEKQNEFIKMINEERKNLGLKGTYH